MNIHITARHFNASTTLQERVQEEAAKLTKFYPQIIDANVILDSDNKNLRSVEITVNILNNTVSAHAQEENMGKAIDLAFERVKIQLKKENEKLKDHKAPPIKSQPILDPVG